MKFYGRKQGAWFDEFGPPSRIGNQRSDARQQDRRRAKRAVRQKAKRELTERGVSQ